MSHVVTPVSITRASLFASFRSRRYLTFVTHYNSRAGSTFATPPIVHNSPTFRRLFSTMAPIERLADKLEAPALDDRSYRVIRLPNKLEALLVHDPDTDKASASVNVNVGSFSDADDMPGMAHAVEHLLFMGTEKVRV